MGAASTDRWRSVAYLLSSIVVGTALFALVVTAIAVAAPLALVGVGVPLLLGAAALVRGGAHVERQRAALVPGVDVVDPPADDGDRIGIDHGLIAAVRSRWTEPAMAPALGYLVGLYVPLVLLDAVAAGMWLSFLAGTTIPLWYWAVPQTFAIGVAIDDLPTALAVAGVMGVLFVVVGCPLAVAAARFHARIAGRLLGPPTDPLAPARAVLRSPGPLPRDDHIAHRPRSHLAAVPPVS